MKTLVAVCGMAVALHATAGSDACQVQSGPRSNVLVELYTSEGCSSCPPADAWLSRLDQRYPADRVVPLALHVDYWDSLGWRDPYAQPACSDRQRQAASRARESTVYTPQIRVQGEATGLGQDPLQLVAQALARPSSAMLSLSAKAGPHALELNIDGSAPGRNRLYLAVTERGLQSEVLRGENAGRRLHHDHVARSLQLLGMVEHGHFTRQLTIPLLRPQQALVAFLQADNDNRIVQAVSLPACGQP